MTVGVVASRHAGGGGSSGLCGRVLRHIAALCVLVAAFAFQQGMAQAAVTHELLRQITEVPGEGPEGEAVPFPGPIEGSEALAVDSGRLYAAERLPEGQRVDVFDAASGEFLLQFPQMPAVERLGGFGLAVGHASSGTQVYLGAGASEGECAGVVAVFDATGSSLAIWTGAATPLGSFGCRGVVSVATDNSTSLSWASGDVYVADRTEGKIDVFKPLSSGQEPEQLEAQLEAEPGVPFEFKGSEQGIVVDQQSGDLLVTDKEGTIVDIFRPATLPGQFERVEPDGALTGTPAGLFTNVTSLAVDAGNGEIYVADGGAGAVDQFDSAGEFLGRLAGTPNAVAVDGASHELYVGGYSPAPIDVFGPDLVIPDVATEPAVNAHPGSATFSGVVNPAGLPVDDCHFDYGTTTSYGQSVPCAQTPAEIGAGNSPVAVSADVSGLTPGGSYHFRLSASNANAANTGADRLVGPPVVDGESSSEIAQTTASVLAEVNPDGVDTSYRFEYGTSTAYGTSVPVPDEDIGSAEVDQALVAQLTGLQAGSTYHYRVVAVNTAGTVMGSDQSFTTVPPARIDAVTVSDLGATSATLHAEIDPLGTDTTYHFEYGSTTSYGANIPIPDDDVGSGTGDVAVAQRIIGLLPDTTYHLRVVAQNALGTVRSSDHTFIYDQSGDRALPDERSYEMITPSQKNATLIGDVTKGVPPQIADDGSRVILGAVQCFADAQSCVGVRVSTGSPYSFTRVAPGWTATALAPPATQFEANSWVGFNADTGTGLFTMPTPPGGQDDFYAREPDGSFLDIGPLSPSPSRELFEQFLGGSKAATADLSHVVIESGLPIWPFDSGQRRSVYEYAHTRGTPPALVGVRGGFGSTDLISACQTELGGEIAEIPLGDLSDDGQVVYFTAGPETVTPCSPAPRVAELFARIDNSEADARTVAISQPSAISPVPPNHACETPACVENTSNSESFRDAQFVGASADGSKVFFTDTQQLTDDASQDPDQADSAHSSGCIQAGGANGCNLYMYDSPRQAPLGGESLTDASAGDLNDGPRVQGVLAFSSDGSHVYFVAKGALTGVANGQGQTAQEGMDNLYVFARDGSHPHGHTAFVATLPESDDNEWLAVGRPANVTPDGRFLVFTSSGELTADDTRTDGAAQVFRYDAQTEQLVRISIGDNGFNDNGNASTGDASIVPGKNGYNRLGAARPDPTMSHDGAYVFFMSPVGLTSGALDSVRIGTEQGKPAYAQNVYEYHDGHVYLISDGRDTSAVTSELCLAASSVCLIGSDATGSNVFFATADQLLRQDTDTQIDFYDARICTASSPCIEPPALPPPPCLGEVCHGIPPAPPAPLTPGSATFSGTGNATPPRTKSVTPKAPTVRQKLAKALRSCRAKRNRHKRFACEKRARKRYGPRPRKAGNPRRGKA